MKYFKMGLKKRKRKKALVSSILNFEHDSQSQIFKECYSFPLSEASHENLPFS